MKFGQWIECNMKNIFLEKSYAKCGGETRPRLFSKKLNLSISLDQQSNFIAFAFIVWQVKGHQNISKLSGGPIALISY